MLDSLRDTIQTVQEGLTASFRGFHVGDLLENERTAAGGQLLHHYQSQWRYLHQVAEHNALTAQRIDHIIGGLYKWGEKQWNGVSQLHHQLDVLPQLARSMQETMRSLGILQGLCEDVESAIISLEDMIEVQELQEKQLDQRFHLALYREKRLGELDQLRVHLSKEHARKEKEVEAKQELVKKERQETFQAAFHEDLDLYKRTGHLPLREQRIDPLCHVTLEQVNLQDDRSALEQFLQEDKDETEPFKEDSMGRLQCVPE